jgi:hypothetical protein
MEEITLENVERIAEQLSAEDKLTLAEHLSAQVKLQTAPAERQPQDLYGLWRGKFPPEQEIDALLYEIRHEWEKELEERGL